MKFLSIATGLAALATTALAAPAIKARTGESVLLPCLLGAP